MSSQPSSSKLPLVLGSTSPFRRELLSRLQLDFVTASPDIDESAEPGEQPERLVIRLAASKADAVALTHPHALIIGSDQVATIEGQILGKPGNHAKAVAQLTMAAGKKVTFYTGLCLLNSETKQRQICCETFHVHFRQLDQDGIENYLRREQPYNCAGSFKSEGLGITLFERLEGNDPNSLIGLPLIQLITMLKKAGLDPLAG